MEEIEVAFFMSNSLEATGAVEQEGKEKTPKGEAA